MPSSNGLLFTSIKGDVLQSPSSHSLHKNTLKPIFFEQLSQLNISILSSVMTLGLYQIQKFKTLLLLPVELKFKEVKLISTA
jgi:hypothetical protein